MEIKLQVNGEVPMKCDDMFDIEWKHDSEIIE